MDYADLLKSGFGAVIGFSLAQLVNVASFARAWWSRPRLIIEADHPNCLLLAHSVEADNGDVYKEEVYGFRVRNAGRRIATGMRVQLIEVEHRGRRPPEMRGVSGHALDLMPYRTGGEKMRSFETVLVPGASISIELAEWREDRDAIFPTVMALPEYYEDICAGSTEYRFTVVAFDDKAHFVRKVFTIHSPNSQARRARSKSPPPCNVDSSLYQDRRRPTASSYFPGASQRSLPRLFTGKVSPIRLVLVHLRPAAFPSRSAG